MSVDRLYPSKLNRFNNWCRKVMDCSIGGFLAKTGTTPNQVTLSGMIICLSACAVWGLQTREHSLLWWGLGIFVIGVLGDVADGSVAKLTGKKTVFGGELDSICDRVVETGMFTALAWVLMHQHRQLDVLACITGLGGSILVSYARTRAEKLGLKGDVGIGDRTVRLAAMGILILLGPWIGFQWAVYAVNALAWPTVAWRTIAIRRQLIAKGTP